MTTSHPTTRHRPGLTRNQIVETARTLLDEGGLDAVTMGAVGDRLGVAAMSLYRHVESKADLLVEIYRRQAEEIVVPTRSDYELVQDWLAAFFRSRRQATLLRPSLGREFTMLYAVDAASGPVGLVPGGQVVDDLVAEGLTIADALAVYVTLNTFNTGFLLWEIDRFHLQTPEDYRRAYLQRLLEADEPSGTTSWEIPDALTGQPIDDLYEKSLSTIIAGIVIQYLSPPAAGVAT